MGQLMIDYIYDDGGRADAGYKGLTSDCVTRAIAIATELPYQSVYDALYGLIREPTVSSPAAIRKLKNSSPRTGVYRQTYDRFLKDLGWTWVPTMQIGSGCRVHLREDELPDGKIICKVSRHLVAVVDGVLHDTHDSSRDGQRCVYGIYFDKNEPGRVLDTGAFR